MIQSHDEFSLDPTLARDCHLLGELHGSLLLLMDNALVPWFILVPKTEVIELCDLPEPLQRSLQAAVNSLSGCLRQSWTVDKLNVAAIGNVVSQLHVHVVGRRRGDFCWPSVVWGRPEKQPYTSEQVDEVLSRLRSGCGGDFIGAGG